MPTLKYTGSSPLPVTVHASCRIQTADKAAGKRQLVVDIPQNPFGKEAFYTVTFSVPPRYKEEDDGDGDEVQDLVHVFRVERISKTTKSDLCEEQSIGRCVICWEAKCDCVFYPCGHITACHECGLKLYLRNQPCPMCRQLIEKFQRVYFSGLK